MLFRRSVANVNSVPAKHDIIIFFKGRRVTHSFNADAVRVPYKGVVHYWKRLTKEQRAILQRGAPWSVVLILGGADSSPICSRKEHTGNEIPHAKAGETFGADNKSVQQCWRHCF